MSCSFPSKFRGYCGIGIFNTKTPVNLGTLWRSAYCLGADFIFTIGDRYKQQCSDTTRSHKHIPYFRYKDSDDFLDHLPYDCFLVGIEIHEKSKPLLNFVHPQRAIYILGPEDGSLSNNIIEKCQHLIQFPSRFCLNVACAGTIVMHDRLEKQIQKYNLYDD